MKPDTDFREILWPIAFLYRENSSRNSGSTRVHRDTDSTCSRKIPFYCAKLNFTFVTYIYIYITTRETPIKMQWKFKHCLLNYQIFFLSFSISCNMPFQITEILFLLPYIISSISSLRFLTFFSTF